MHGQEIFQVFTDLNHSDLGLCTGYKLQGARKILIFVYIKVLCCAIFDIKLKKTTRVTNWQELYVCSDNLKVKIFTNGSKRQRKFKQQRLANSTKLLLGLRLLLYVLYSVFLIKLSGDVEINPGPQSNTSQNLQRKKPQNVHQSM